MTKSHISALALAISLNLGLPIAARATDALSSSNGTPVADAADTSVQSIIVTAKATRSATALPGAEIQKILPGISPLKAIQTLPGVLYITSDPWGYNEQNAQLFIHGFASNQLGYTMDGVPLGDQSYGNYNGLAPQRAVISENVGRVVVATGAGDLATASNSNLGGTVETYSSDPLSRFGAQIGQTFGSYSTSRTFARIDSGDFGDGNSAYISAARQHARAWDFNGKQGGYQVNAKFVHEDGFGKLTAFFDWNDMTQPNEDATVFFKPSAGKTATAVQLYTPYTKPFYYPDFNTYRTQYLSALGNNPAAVNSNIAIIIRTRSVPTISAISATMPIFRAGSRGRRPAIIITMTASASSPAPLANRSPRSSRTSIRTMRPIPIMPPTPTAQRRWWRQPAVRALSPARPSIASTAKA